MKKMILFLTLAVAVFIPSCSNDIDLVADWKDIPIVYGLLSKSEAANYIRIEKAFLDNDKSALEIAQIPDSLYYENITVQIKSVDADNPVTYDLFRVDGNLEGFPRESGVFADAPNYLYKLELPDGETLDGGAVYELQINRGDNLPLVTAQATIVDDIQIRDPDLDPDDAQPINWARFGIKIGWRAQIDAQIFDAKLLLNIEEQDLSNPANDRVVTLEWKVEENEPPVIQNNQVRMQASLNPSELYSFLSNRLEINPNISRKILSIDVLISAGGEALAEYINAGNANTGITSTQIIPNYTNLSEGRGIFSSKNEALHEGYRIHVETLDSLRANPLTRDLNF